MHLITTLGPKSKDELGLILPHEHVFTDLRTPDQPGYAEADIDDVLRQISPEIDRASEAGITAIVECSPIGVGRRVDYLKAVAKATSFPLVAPTGVYREPWAPEWVHNAREAELHEWMQGELEGEIEDTGVQAGFIKLSAGDDGITGCETKVLRAAARAAKETGAVIGSHTIRGSVVKDQLGIIEDVGLSLSRFIWIHASAEPNIELNVEIARRGAWIEYDWIGSEETDADTLQRTAHLLDVGLEGHILLSQDNGWYDPSEPGGGPNMPYAYFVDSFIPKMRAAGLDEPTIRRLTHDNPFRAFAR